MLLSLLLFSFVLKGDPIASAIGSFEALSSYSVTLRSTSGATEIIRYHYKKPGYVRMEFVEPHKGAVLVYDPVRKTARLRPFQSVGLALTLSPDSWLIKSARGHTVDRSDLGSLLKAVKEVLQNGSMEVVGERGLSGRAAVVVRVTGAEGFALPDGVHAYELWLDKGISLPIKVLAFDSSGVKTEEVLMDDLEAGVEFPEGFFTVE